MEQGKINRSDLEWLVVLSRVKDRQLSRREAAHILRLSLRRCIGCADAVGGGMHERQADGQQQRLCAVRREGATVGAAEGPRPGAHGGSVVGGGGRRVASHPLRRGIMAWQELANRPNKAVIPLAKSPQDPAHKPTEKMKRQISNLFNRWEPRSAERL